MSLATWQRKHIMADNLLSETSEDETPFNLGGASSSVYGWVQEANSVIKDVCNHVKLIEIADNPKVSLRILSSQLLQKGARI